ncbi:hypothetical protein POSPLADRAFT_1172465 [Postia placenta MAD-698-R-SB12]|uniref:F-box domain-containing protein n=1 Tax=Postia placenta MAD-698-R-SB12 TaxID=670580 RepID=A0A1X6MSJ6_9APHY|nr:hypothetical protein POSPLADRAFT_1172465 [Postia placenta MAD-698-R-SB12]OSX59230.1 hypothetical protein POSPLADRAFT_1172465 [Postia placenta MAD-698-R-SB12]
MSLTALPTELLDAICEPLASNASTLASLARACAATHGSAMRMLYRSVSVSTYAGNLPVVHTLAIRPELARHVRSFAIALDDSDAVLRPYYALLQAALQQMSQLESLELYVDSSASWVLLDLNDPSRLEHFACAFPLDPNVTAFLSRTPALRSLQIADPAPSTVPALHSMHFPLLESYTGPASLLPLLASRPLTTIHLSGDLKIEDIPHSGSAPEAKTGDVQILSAITSTPPALLLETLARAYPGLVCLRLMTTFAFWQAPDMTLYSRIADTLASMSSLTVFELSGMHWESRPKSPGSLPAVGGERKEWISPPVTPRAAENQGEAETFLENQNQNLGFGEAFLDWSY